MSQRRNKKRKISEHEVLDDPVVRIALARRSHSLFFDLYYTKYQTYDTAPFQYEMFAITEDEDIKLAVIAGFRESAKTTINTESNVLWSIFGKPQKKFVLIISQRMQKAQLLLSNIKQQLENNSLLRHDMGPFRQEKGQGGADSLYIPKFDAKVIAASVEQGIRGFKHKQHRPDLIILDDVEDFISVRSIDSRNNTWAWFTREVIPVGSDSTKIIVVGNVLHGDSFIMRLKDRIESGDMDGIYREYPIVDDDGNPLWPSRFPTPESIERKKKKVGDIYAWTSEYELRIIPPESQAVRKEWLQYYDTLPKERPDYIYTGVDPAISLADGACFTAAVTTFVYGSGDDLRIYILPNPINKRMEILDTMEMIKQICTDYPGSIAFTEDVSPTGIAAILSSKGLAVEAVKVSQSKEVRLRSISYLFQAGKVFVPFVGAEELLQQLLQFGIEKYDDLVDALTLVLAKIIATDLDWGNGPLIRNL